MSSYISWIDHSEHERRRVLGVIDTFREQDTRDELGIGSVRDAIAGLLFPGTSTVQTRARYFLFVAWIYLRHETKKTPSAEIAQRARKDEIALIDALLAGGERGGVIGVESRRSLQRLPSNIYWQGLGTLGIRHFNGSQDPYHRSLDRHHASPARLLRDDDGEPIEGVVRRNWDSGIPAAPADFLQTASFALTPEEAVYLRDRITLKHPRSLLAFLVDRGKPWEDVDFAWQHPQFGSFPSQVIEQLEHARAFSETMRGAAVLYNWMLAEKAGREDLVEAYRNQMEEWAVEIAERGVAFERWDLRRFWQVAESQGARIGPATRRFVESWVALASPGEGTSDRGAEARRLIQERERRLKGKLARLDDPRALERWNGAAGLGQLDYRWGRSSAIALDVLAGLEGGS